MQSVVSLPKRQENGASQMPSRRSPPFPEPRRVGVWRRLCS